MSEMEIVTYGFLAAFGLVFAIGAWLVRVPS
jgi:hypothetical protein